MADVNQLMGQKVDSTEHGAWKGSEEILGMLSTTCACLEDLSCDLSHHDLTTHLNFKATPSPTGPNPHIDLSACKTQPIDSIQTSPCTKPPRKIGPFSPPQNSFHQTKAQFENHSLLSNLKPNRLVKRKSTNSNPLDLLAKKPKLSQIS